MLIETHKRPCFWKPGSQRVNESQKRLKSAEKHFRRTFSSFRTKLNLKKSFLLRSEISRLFVSMLSAGDKYSRHNRENLPLPIQIQLSKKPKTFCCFFIEFLECKLNVEHFEEQLNLIAYVFLKLLTPKDVVIEMHKSSCFWKPFHSQHVKESQKLVKPAENHFCARFASFGVKLKLKKSFLFSLRFLDCLLTRRLPMTSILVIIRRIYRYQFKCNYLKNQRHFATFLLNF